MTERIIEFAKNYEEDSVESEIVVLVQDGLGFGEGKISTKAQIETGELTDEALVAANEIILNDPAMFVTISPEITDDGCGDGRPTDDIWVTDDEGNEIHYNKSYPRAKIFGGGLVVAASMWRVLKGAPNNETAFGDREFIAKKLKERNISWGAHSDEHAHGDNCGCGAIDRYPQISANVLAYEPQIRQTLGALYGEKLASAQSAIDTVFERYAALGEEYFADAAGSKTMGLIEQSGAVIKKLSGDHQEDVFVLNDIENTTFDQPAFDKAIQARGINVPVQAFAVDVWRGRMYADAMASIASEAGVQGDVESLRQIAYADFLIRTLAVTATLTAGDLPGYAKRRVGQTDLALIA